MENLTDGTGSRADVHDPSCPTLRQNQNRAKGWATRRGVLLVILVAFVCPASWLGRESPAVANVLKDTVQGFDLADATMFEALIALSRADARVALGYEEVLTADAKPRGETVRFSIALHDSNVRDVLDALCNLDHRYTWAVDGRVINVFPRATVGDSSYLLNRKLRRVQMMAVPDPFEALTPIARQLPDEQVGYAQVGGGDTTYSKPWSARLEGVTVRQVINRAAQQLGSRGSWTFHGSVDFRTFAFFRDGFSLVHPR